MPNEHAVHRPPTRSHRTPLRRRLVAAGAVPVAILALVGTPTVLATLGGADSAVAAAPSSSARPPTPAIPATSLYTISTTPRWTPQVFGPTSAWRKLVTAAPVNVDSRVMVADLAHQVAVGNSGNASFNVWQYGATIVKVAATQKRITVKFDDCQHKGYTPSGLYNGTKQFVGIPIPDSAKPSSGSDASMTIWSPATNQMWSLWKARKLSNGWHACWGGRIDHLWTSPGYYTGGFGASASGLAAGGAIRIDEIRNGRIPHAISIGIRDYGAWRRISWPAQRSDGSSSSSSKIIMGTRFRLPKSVDVNKLGLTSIGKIIAVAAQNYGFIVTEKSGVVAMPAENGATIAARTGTNPWIDLMGASKSYNVLHNFPWSRLQALSKDYGKP